MHANTNIRCDVVWKRYEEVFVHAFCVMQCTDKR